MSLSRACSIPPLTTHATCLDALQAEEGELEEQIRAEEEQLDLEQLQLKLLGTLQQLERQRDRAWLQQSMLENEQLCARLELHRRFKEVQMQQVEVKLSEARSLNWGRFEKQLRDLDPAEQAQVQVTAASKRFPALHTLTLGAAPFRVLDGASLAMSLAMSLASLAALPPSQLKALTLIRCRFSAAEAEQLGKLVLRSGCLLSLELSPRASEEEAEDEDGEDDEDDEDDNDDPGDQLGMIISGGLAPTLQSLYLGEGIGGPALRPVSLLETLSSLTALRELTLPGRVMDAQAAQVLQGMTLLVVLRLGGWAMQGEGGDDEQPPGPPTTLPMSLRRLDLLND